NPGCGLAFRDSKCDTGESPDRVHNVPPKRAEIGRIRAFIRQLESETASGWCGSRTALRSADRHHNETSWTMSWASAALPRMRCSKAGPVSDPTSVVWAFARLGCIPKILDLVMEPVAVSHTDQLGRLHGMYSRLVSEVHRKIRFRPERSHAG